MKTLRSERKKYDNRRYHIRNRRFPSVELQLASSEGLAPLTLPQSLPQPPHDAVRRFQTAMLECDPCNDTEDGISRRDAVNELVDILRTSREGDVSRRDVWTQRDFDNVDGAADTTPAATPSNPVNHVNPVKETNPIASDTAQQATPISATSAPLREIKTDVADASAAPVVEGDVSRRDVWTQRDFYNVDGATDTTPVATTSNPVNPVNPVKETKPVAGDTAPQTSPSSADSAPLREIKTDVAAGTQRVDVADEEKAVAVSQHVVVSTAAVETPAPQVVQAAPETSVASAASARTVAVAETVNQIVEAVAAQILVTPALSQGEGELRIVLKPDVLDGSEIRLSAKDGTLTVAIVPTP